MSDTTMYTKGLDDGWFLVASAADNVSIKSNSTGFWHAAVAATKPAADFVGEKHTGLSVKQIAGLSGNVYVRVATAHNYAVTVGVLQQGVTYGLDDSGALVALGITGGAAHTRKTGDDVGEERSAPYVDAIVADITTALRDTVDGHCERLGLPFHNLSFTKSAGVEAVTIRWHFTVNSGYIVISGLTGETVAIEGLTNGNSQGNIFLKNSTGAFVQATTLGNGTYKLDLG